MRAVSIVLAFICMGQLIYILHIRKQLAEWLVFFEKPA